MKIQKVRFKNFRNVPDIERELNGSNIILLAENTYGKSNFIKGIQAALSGKVGIHAIANGKDMAEVEVKLSDFDQEQVLPGTDYTFKLKVKKDKSGEEKVTLEVIAPNGFKETRKTIIGSIAGEVELDFNFVELSKTAAGKKKQLEIIKSFMDEETKSALALHENKAQQVYNERTDVNRELAAVKGFILESGVTALDFDKYSSPIEIGVLQSKIGAAIAFNDEVKGIEARMKERHQRREVIEAELIKLNKELDEVKEKSFQASEWLKANKPMSIESIQVEIQDATEHNMKHQKVKDLKGKQVIKEELEGKVGELTALYESSRQAISDAIRDMNYPIKGITIDENNVYYNGKVVDESTLSTAEIMMLEVELKMSKLPNAAVVFVQRGESLGLNMLSQLQTVAKERGYQLVMEQVERGTEELRIELMPDFTIEQVAV